MCMMSLVEMKWWIKMMNHIWVLLSTIKNLNRKHNIDPIVNNSSVQMFLTSLSWPMQDSSNHFVCLNPISSIFESNFPISKHNQRSMHRTYCTPQYGKKICCYYHNFKMFFTSIAVISVCYISLKRCTLIYTPAFQHSSSSFILKD